MKWNVEDIAFLHRPDIFAGSFENTKMQARYEQEIQKKLEAIKTAIDCETDPFEAMKKLHTRDHLQFFLNNLGSFRDAGKLEEAVLALYCKHNDSFSSGGDVIVWNNLIEACDTKRLYNLGDPVTFTSATIYRGSILGFKRGLSWTPNRQRVENFAKRWKDPSLGGGELYEMDITKSDVLIYFQHRREEEILLAPTFIKTAEIRIFNTGLCQR